jgi:hypothetical protein
MRSDTIHVTFRFPLGHHVRWALAPDHPWRVLGRRYYEGEVLQFVQYHLLPPDGGTRIAYEPDLAPWPEPRP